MNQLNISIISSLVNILLTIFKLIVGFLIGSVALIAEGIHSGLDVVSSIVTWLGIKSSSKPADKEHPYGHFRSESLASLVVVMLLAISAFWILYEGITRFFISTPISWSIWGLVVMGFSAIINEVMARAKFYYGKKMHSIGLISDAKHSRTDVIASIGLFIGLILIKYYNLADAILAIVVGIYILIESWFLVKQVSQSLLDTSDVETEKQIEEISKDLELVLEDVKTRQAGGKIFAEIKVLLDPRLKLKEVDKQCKEIEKILKKKIERLEYIIIKAEPYK